MRGLAAAVRLAGAFLRRDLQEAVSYRFSMLVDAVGILFYMAMFYFIARLVDGSGVSIEDLVQGAAGAGAPVSVEGMSRGYFPFVLVGLAFYGFFGTATQSFSAAIRNAQVRGTLEAMLSTATPLEAILLCSSLGSFCYTSLEIFFYPGVGWLVFGVSLSGAAPVATLVVLLATVAAFSGLGILSAAFVLRFQRGDPVGYALSTVSGLLGGVFYPVDVLPEWLRQAAWYLPITHAPEAARLTILEGVGLFEVRWYLAALAGFTAVLVPVGLGAFRLAVRRAKVEGSLCRY